MILKYDEIICSFGRAVNCATYKKADKIIYDTWNFQLLKRCSCCHSSEIPFTLATFHNFNASLDDIQTISSGPVSAEYEGLFLAVFVAGKSRQPCPRGEWVITLESWRANGMFTLPWGHHGDGHAPRSPTGFALGPLCFGCRLLKANYPLTEARLHTTFAVDLQCICSIASSSSKERDHFTSVWVSRP